MVASASCRKQVRLTGRKLRQLVQIQIGYEPESLFTLLELARQDVHVSPAEAPVVVEYVFAPQSTQVLAAEAPFVVRYLPSPQLVHESEPRASLYFPAAHCEHVSPSAPVSPALH
jgi:hypothetical protein